MDEEWKPIPDYPDYEVSNQGRFRRSPKAPPAQGSKPGTVIKSSPNSDGYGVVSLRKDGKTLNVRAHTMVAKVWMPDKWKDGMTVNHKDRDRLNNAVDNLEVVTWSANVGHGRLTEKRLTEILDLLEEGYTPKQVAKTLGLTYEVIELAIKELYTQGKVVL